MLSDFGQLFLIGLSGKSLTADEKKFIVENNIGGVTLFGRNCESPEQLYALCSELQSLSQQQKDKTPLFIGIDMEGGRVHRLKAPFTQWPALDNLGKIDSPNLSYHFAMAMGEELKAVGINLDYAPCADIFTNPKNTVIGDRAASSDPEVVSRHVSALIRGYVKSGIIPCAKHFPGHGDTLVDSHLDLPIEKASLDELRSRELLPFKKAIRSKVELIMTSHILFKNVDPKWPATLSEIFIKKLLREELGYRGFIISDDMGMKAMSAKFPVEEIPVRALEVGVDLLLYCNEFDVPPIALSAVTKAVGSGRLNQAELQARVSKILKWKQQVISPIGRKEFKLIGCENHQNMSACIRRGEIPLELQATDVVR